MKNVNARRQPHRRDGRRTAPAGISGVTGMSRTGTPTLLWIAAAMKRVGASTLSIWRSTACQLSGTRVSSQNGTSAL